VIQRPSIARATANLFILSLLSPFLGMALEIVLAWAFGTSALVDGYRVASLLLVFGLQLFFGQMITGVVVPMVAEFRARGRELEAWQAAFTISCLTCLLALPVALFTTASPERLQRLLGPGLTGDAQATAQLLIRWYVIAFVVFVWTGVGNGLLQAYRWFWAQPVSQSITNFCLITLVVTVGRHNGPAALAAGALLGVGLSVLLYGTSLARLARHRGLPLRDCLRFRVTGELRNTLKLAIPILGLLVASQWHQVITNRVVSTLSEGALASMGYAMKLRMLASLLPITFATVLFPTLADAAASGFGGRLQDLAQRSLHLMLFLTVPLVLVLIAVREPITLFIYQWGSLDASGAARIAEILTVLFPIIPAIAVTHLLFRLAYARKATAAPFWHQFAVAAGMTAFAAPAAAWWGVRGVVLAYTVLTWASVLGLAIYLGTRHKLIQLRPLARFAGQLVLVATATSSIIFVVQAVVARLGIGGRGGLLVEAVAVCGLALVGALAVARTVRMPEADEIIGRLLTLRRSAREQTITADHHTED
jgi:putative peptidoglycan lipid II flippase